MAINVTDESGNIVSIDGWPTSISKAALHEDYLMFLDKHRETRTRRSTETELGIFLKRVTPMETQRRLPGAKVDKTEWFWNLPSVEECRAFWAKSSGWETFDADTES